MGDAEIVYDELLSAMGRGMQPNAIRKLTALLGRRDIISLAAGAPASETFPVEELAEIAARVIRSRGQFALQYGPTRGPQSLLEAIAEMLAGRGIIAKPAEIVVTSGSQQGLDLVARLLIDPGDVAMVELPSYIGGIIALHNAQAEMVGVDQDDGGLVIEDLREKITALRHSGRRVKCIYTIPNFQNPSGVTLAGERREQLVRIADEFDLLIVEDDPYFDLAFGETSRPPALAALRPERVIYLGSFSKVLAPGLRAAYLRAPAAIAAKVEMAKEGADLSTSVLDQAMVLEALRSGLIEKRLPELRQFYEVRCRAMLDALDEHAPAGSRWTRPTGGFFILLEMAAGMDATAALPQAIDCGVAYVPGQPFFVDGGGANTLRLAYSKETPAQISEGIARLGRVLAGTQRAEAV
ncbi:MAG TPA: PLP-dependent aminotransferase family protein [Blastocatellia bacterium]|nr:PLP-dependent aminotransferase family protein [Blastocatellia bacterium]